MQVLSALSLYLSEFAVWSTNAQKQMDFPVSVFLQFAREAKDDVLFYNIFRRLENENAPKFEESLQQYRQYYNQLCRVAPDTLSTNLTFLHGE